MLRIHRLSLENYCNFETKDIILDQHTNILIGANGSGKTNILNAAAVALGTYLSFIDGIPKQTIPKIYPEDVRIEPGKKSDWLGRIIMESQYPCSISATICTEGNVKVVNYSLPTLDAKPVITGVNPLTHESIPPINADNDIVLPLILYFGANRQFKEKYRASGDRKSEYSRIDGYTRCLNGMHHIDFALDCLLAMDESMQRVILDVLNTAFRLVFGPVGEMILFPNDRKNAIACKENGQIVPFFAMSNGHKQLVKIVLDIITRMHVLNPFLHADALIKTPGVVLIDSIESGLHPSAQANIIDTLHKLFPNVQFVYTTQSPFVIQMASFNEIFPLD